MKNTSTAPMSYIYDGRECLGFILARGCAGFEAFDREGNLGIAAAWQTLGQAAARVVKKLEEGRR
jgi:hypothetical protein